MARVIVKGPTGKWLLAPGDGATWDLQDAYVYDTHNHEDFQWLKYFAEGCMSYGYKLRVRVISIA